MQITWTHYSLQGGILVGIELTGIVFQGPSSSLGQQVWFPVSLIGEKGIISTLSDF